MRELSLTKRVEVRFSELDPLKVVWHGNYVKYLEDAREEFGRRFGIGYSELVKNGYYAPVYDVRLRYERPAVMNDVLLVKITYRPAAGAKMVFDYEIHRESDGALILTASTIQLFETSEGEFCPIVPDFYRTWQERVCYDFYKVNACERTDSGFMFNVSLMPDSEVYEGHFPGKPVAPGVCMMQMVKECYEYASCTVTRLEKIKLCRFLRLVEPLKVQDLQIQLDAVESDGKADIQASVFKNEEVFVSLKAELSFKDNG